MDYSKSAASAAAVLLASVFVTPSAFASDQYGQVRTQDIKFEDLNLATTAGVDVLYKRIHSAAQRVCAQPQPQLGAAVAVAKCNKEAVARAVKEINLPALTAFAVNR